MWCHCKNLNIINNIITVIVNITKSIDMIGTFKYMYCYNTATYTNVFYVRIYVATHPVLPAS